MGSVYRRKGSAKLWIKYTQHGRTVRESTETTNMLEARRMLRNREGQVSKGLPVTPDVGRVTFDEAVDDLMNDYALNQRKSTDDTRRRIEKHLRPYFGNRRMITITTADLRAFVAKRQKDGVVVRRKRAGKVPPGESATEDVQRPVSAAELNRELTILKRMFSLAVQAAKLHYKPHFPMLRENNVRTGFFEPDQYRAVLKHLPPAMRPPATFAYVTGWRMYSEVLKLEWRQVDLAAGEVRLDPGSTKNGEGRVFYLTPELQSLLEAQRQRADEIQRAQSMVVLRVFFHTENVRTGGLGVRTGRPIRADGFYHAWQRAKAAAGCPATIPHDLRRTAIRNMVRAGIPERVAMALAGHKTRSVFDRYNIVSETDLREASRRLAHV